MHVTGRTLNTYFAMLVVTLVASSAALLIIRIATTDVSRTALGAEAEYQSLQQSILGK